MKSCLRNKKIHDEQKAIRKKILKCFWSWPFGHCWHKLNGDDWSCCNCQKFIDNNYAA